MSETPAPALPADLELVPLADVARLWRTKADTVRSWARRGEIPAVHIGRLVYFRPADLRAFLAVK